MNYQGKQSIVWDVWVHMLVVGMYVKIVFAFCLIFMKSTTKKQLYLRLFFLYTNYLIIPVFTIGGQIFFWTVTWGKDTDLYVMWEIVYSCNQIGSFLSFFLIVLPRIKNAKRKNKVKLYEENQRAKLKALQEEREQLLMSRQADIAQIETTN